MQFMVADTKNNNFLFLLLEEEELYTYQYKNAVESLGSILSPSSNPSSIKYNC